MKKNLFKMVYEKILNNLCSNGVSIIGLHGPQGMGKTTLNTSLKKELSKIGYNVLILSIDDFYYEYKVLNDKLKKFNNKLYKYRGLSGTHDVYLLSDTIINIKKNKNTLIPIYNKNKYNGLGDREGYYESGVNIDIVILEGWLIGYDPQNNISDDCYLFNENLKLYDIIKNKINFWIKIESDKISNIYDWRWSAEDKKNGMNKETFDSFFEPYLKIYNNYKVTDKEKIIIDKDRNVIN